MDDLEIDRTLRATLSENPSPDFVARVRTTLAEAPRPSFVAGWLKPAAAVACAAVVAIAMGLPREEAPAQAGLKASTTYGPSTTTVQAETATVVVPTFRSAKSAKPAAHPQTSNTDEPLPEVIIAQKDVEALREFIASANEVRFTASFDETPAPTPWLVTELPTTQTHNN